MKIIVPLATGFEEIEAVTIIDVLRRAQIDVIAASLENAAMTGAHHITINPDGLLEDMRPGDFNGIILPGGMPGSRNLLNNRAVIELTRTIYERGGLACAICAAPIVLGRTGILKGKKATCYPGYESHLEGAIVKPDPVVIDERIVTGRGPGCAIPFALAIVELLRGKDTAENLREDMQVYWT